MIPIVAMSGITSHPRKGHNVSMVIGKRYNGRKETGFGFLEFSSTGRVIKLKPEELKEIETTMKEWGFLLAHKLYYLNHVESIKW